jgi:metal-responsive CopG/Arc/MetJ family transcriptional regulator
MSYARISITLDRKVADELRQTAGPRGVSAYVNEAIRQQLQAGRLRKMLKEMEEEAGPIPPEVQAEVDKLEWPD